MVNRQGRSPGKLDRLEGYGQVSQKPGAAVESGAKSFLRLQSATGQLANSLGALADRASVREGEAEGLAAGDVDLGIARANAPEAVVSNSLVSKIIGVESAGKADAKNPRSSALGAGQIIGSTFLGLIGRHRPELAAGRSKDEILALRTDKALSIEMAGHYISEIKSSLKSAGITPTDGDVYLGYFLGPAGARAMLKAAPGASTLDVLTSVVGSKKANAMLAANPTILPNKTAGQVRAWAHKKMGGKGAIGSADANLAGEARPPASGPPLALRRDGTKRGAAHDNAVLRSLSWRMSAEVDDALAEAHELYQDDPAKLREEINQIQQKSLGQLGNDPEILEMATKSFETRRRIYERDADAKAERRQDAEHSAAADNAFDSSQKAIERQAFLAGTDPEAEAALTSRLEGASGQIDGAVEVGAITPQEGERRKRNLIDKAAVSRIRGVYESLPDATAKEDFAAGLLDEWKAGDGPISELDFGTVKALTSELRTTARAQAREGSAAAATSKLRFQRLVADDVASLRSTGVGLEIEGEPLDEARVASVLGETAAQSWSQQRSFARDYHDATAGLEKIPTEEIGARVAGLVPVAGTPGFAEREALHDQVTKEASRIVKLRRADPVRAVEEAFPDVAALREAANGDDPAAVEAMIVARLDAQEALGIPEMARLPLTSSEAQAIVQQINAVPENQARDALTDIAQLLDEAYGSYADEAMAQVLQAKGVERNMAKIGTAIARRMKLGERPARSQAQALDTATDAAAADDAMTGASAPPPMGPVPTYAQIQRLLGNPDLAPHFDAKFGAGMAEKYFEMQQSDQARHAKRYDGITINDDGSEDFKP